MIAGHNHLAASGLRALLVTLFKHKLHKQMMCSLKKQNNPYIFNNVCQFDPESLPVQRHAPVINQSSSGARRLGVTVTEHANCCQGAALNVMFAVRLCTRRKMKCF